MTRIHLSWEFSLFADTFLSYSIEANDLTDFRFSTINLSTLAIESNFTIASVCELKQRCYLYAAATSLSGNALVGASHHGGIAYFR